MTKSMEHFKNLYEEYVSNLNHLIDDYFEGKFNTFREDTYGEKWIDKFIVNENIDKISKYYAYLTFVEKANEHLFIRDITEFANNYGYEKELSIIERYGKKDMLALDVALHYKLWNKNTYDNKEFNTLSFSKTTIRMNVTTTHLVLVFLFMVYFSGDDIKKIEPMSWGLVESIIKQLANGVDN